MDALTTTSEEIATTELGMGFAKRKITRAFKTHADSQTNIGDNTKLIGAAP